jgi:hypothetical protein
MLQAGGDDYAWALLTPPFANVLLSIFILFAICKELSSDLLHSQLQKCDY